MQGHAPAPLALAATLCTPCAARPAPQAKKDDPFSFVKDTLAPAPPPPPPVPPAPLLRLHEAWRAHVEGSLVTHVGVRGAVEWAADRADALPRVPVVGFGLWLPPTPEQEAAAAGRAAARAEAAAARTGGGVPMAEAAAAQVGVGFKLSV